MVVVVGVLGQVVRRSTALGGVVGEGCHFRADSAAVGSCLDAGRCLAQVGGALAVDVAAVLLIHVCPPLLRLQGSMISKK